MAPSSVDLTEAVPGDDRSVRPDLQHVRTDAAQSAGMQAAAVITASHVRTELEVMLDLSAESLGDRAILQLYLFGGPVALKSPDAVIARVEKLRDVLREIADSEVARSNRLPTTVDKKFGKPADWPRVMKILFALEQTSHPKRGGLTRRQMEAAELLGIGGKSRAWTFGRRARGILLDVVAQALVHREQTACNALAAEDGSTGDGSGVISPKHSSVKPPSEPTKSRSGELADLGVDAQPPDAPPAATSSKTHEASAAQVNRDAVPDDKDGGVARAEEANEDPDEPGVADVSPAQGRSVRRLALFAATGGLVMLGAVVATVILTSHSTSSRPSHASASPTTHRTTHGDRISRPVRPTPPSPKPPVRPDPLTKLAANYGLSWGSDNQLPTYQDGNDQTIGTGDQPNGVGTVSIGNTERDNAISGRLWYSGYGFARAVIATKGRYQTMIGVVGIDDNTPCPRNTARVRIENERGHVLWGPETVSIGQMLPLRVTVHGASRVDLINDLTHHSAVGGDECAKGDADVAWASISLVPVSG